MVSSTAWYAYKLKIKLSHKTDTRGRGEASAGVPAQAPAYLSGAPAVEGAEGAAVVWPERVVLRRLPPSSPPAGRYA